MEKFYHKDKLIGIKLDNFTTGTNTVTDQVEPLQLLLHSYEKGKEIKSHFHTPAERQTKNLQECLIVKKGVITIQLFSLSGEKLDSLVLSAGEAFILLRGGWGITLNEDSEFFEIKNGPFLDDRIDI